MSNMSGEDYLDEESIGSPAPGESAEDPKPRSIRADPQGTGKPVGSRRPHRKSRRGCMQCKQRRIKCDEGKPSCAKCVHYSTPCSFLQLQPVTGPKIYDSASEPQSHTSTPPSGPSSQSQPSSYSQIDPALHDARFPSLNPSHTFSISDLELFLHFSTNTYTTIPPIDLWPIAVPALAFKHPFIAHELIALSALHMAYLEPHRKDELLREAHRNHQICLVGFQEILHNINEQTYHASTMGASLLTVYTWASHTGNLFLHDPNDGDSDSGRIELVQLLRGQRSIIRSGRKWLSSGPMWRHAKPWLERSPDEVPSAEDEKHLSIVQPLFSPEIQTEDGKVRVATWKVLRSMFAVTNCDNGISDAEAALGMLTHITPEYLVLVQNHDPLALVLLAHYCVLLKRTDKYWWLEGSAEKLLAIIVSQMAPEWHVWIQWPLQEVRLQY